MVAPSFQSMTVMSETYTKNGKLYIDVKNEKTGTIRSVRWYSENEYNKIYSPEKKVDEKWYLGKNAFPNGLMNARGFSKGPILLIRNNTPQDEDWLKLSPACYATDFGWHIRSTETLPDDAPAHFRYLLLTWDEIKDPSDPTNNTSISIQDREKIIQDKIKNNMWINIRKGG